MYEASRAHVYLAQESVFSAEEHALSPVALGHRLTGECTDVPEELVEYSAQVLVVQHFFSFYKQLCKQLLRVLAGALRILSASETGNTQLHTADGTQRRFSVSYRTTNCLSSTIKTTVQHSVARSRLQNS